MEKGTLSKLFNSKAFSRAVSTMLLATTALGFSAGANASGWNIPPQQPQTNAASCEQQHAFNLGNLRKDMSLDGAQAKARMNNIESQFISCRDSRTSYTAPPQQVYQQSAHVTQGNTGDSGTFQTTGTVIVNHVVLQQGHNGGFRR